MRGHLAKKRVGNDVVVIYFIFSSAAWPFFVSSIQWRVFLLTAYRDQFSVQLFHCSYQLCL